ncbi:unnamed protein product [Discula destructiva]
MLPQLRNVNLTAVPDCGVPCLAEGLYHTACSLTNQTCLCFEPSYNDWVTACVKSNCTVRNQLRTARATNVGCGIEPTSDYNSFMVPEVIVFGFSTLFFFLRLANRASRMAPWGWDDTTSSIAWVFCLFFLGIGIAEVKLEASKSLWAREFWQIDNALFVFWLSAAFYTIALGLIKSSILFLYIRIFRDPSFQRFIWATQLFNLLLVISFTVCDFLECEPLSYFWQSWDLEHKGTCFNINAFAKTHSGINIALDVWMIILPATQVWKLNMSVRWKVEAMAMFAVGIFLTIATCIRLESLNYFHKDPTNIKSYFPVAIWTVVELNIGVVASCMPAARLYVAKTTTDFARSLGWTRFSEGSRPTYEDSNPPSFIKRRSERFAAKLRCSLPALPTGLGGTHFVKTVNRDLPESEHRPADFESHVELVDVESKGS